MVLWIIEIDASYEFCGVWDSEKYFLFKNILNFIFNIARENYSKRLQSMLVWIKEMEENENLHVKDGSFYWQSDDYMARHLD